MKIYKNIVALKTTKAICMDYELINGLKAFNLTDYEAKAYIALASLGTASVTEVSQICNVPRSNLYSVLESLNEKGFVDVQKGRPVIFKAVSPEEALEDAERELSERTKKAKESVIGKLKDFKGKETSIVPALIWGIKGYSNVLAKIQEIIRKSRSEVMINVPDVSIFDDKIYAELQKARERGVKVRMAVEKRGDIEKFKKICMVRVREKIHGTDIMIDDKEVLVAPSFPIAAAWIDNPEMAVHVKDFLNLVWKDSVVLK